MTPPVRSEPDYGKRSLAYMRRVTGKPIPKAHTVKELCIELGKSFGLSDGATTPLLIGDILLWPDVSELGDCTLYLGKGRMLVLDTHGTACIMPIQAFGKDATYYVMVVDR